ncbi:MAG: hypothetical protein UY48_C0022G0012 [Candidatus Gottesmanbacteria bacterium GW2011_GWB1_49_7]|uniref:Phage major capsid protein n=1 Tax=Candidatus Gottesmanbacteria bacterium GW2011_GWB1_49_7 TaxID=1618448 RepID=A0A0G1YY33_9BACT|nr:MAG: hypothetical protein UY48_C0022G0012 [Candidatus Gottesmanbacteria bacterium GW2011_GWB1_49_7]
MPYNTEADIATFVNTVWEDAMLVARDNNVMSGLVNGFGDLQGLAVRKNAKYNGTAAFNQISETDDLTSQSFTPVVDQTLTPYEYGSQFFITDSRLETDIFAVRQDAAQEFGAAYGQKIDTFLAGMFSSLTGGTVGAAGTNMSWANFFAAITKMRRALAPRPWVAVLTPEQWHCLGTAIAPGVTVTNSPFIQDEFIRQFYVGGVSGVDIFTTANIATGTSVYGGMFSRNALALDIRRPLRIEPERDASLRGFELNASSVFAYGVWRPQYGIAINTAGTAPA